jgi:hypothetical protein
LAAVDIDAWNNSGFVCQEQRQLQLYWAAQLQRQEPCHYL